WLGVVVGAHHEAVGSGAADHQPVADARLGEALGAHHAALVLREDVAGLAERAAHDDLELAARRALAAGRRDRHWVIGAGQHRTRQRVEAGIDQVEGVRARALHGAYLGEQPAGLGHQVAAGLDLEAHRVAELVRQAPPRRVPDPEVGVDVDLGVAVAIRGRQTAARADRAHRGADAPRDRPARLGHQREMLGVGARPDVHVHAGDAQPGAGGAPHAVLELLVPDAVLGVLAARVGLAVVSVAEAGIHAQRELATRDARAVLVDHVRR